MSGTDRPTEETSIDFSTEEILRFALSGLRWKTSASGNAVTVTATGKTGFDGRLQTVKHISAVSLSDNTVLESWIETETRRLTDFSYIAVMGRWAQDLRYSLINNK